MIRLNRFNIGDNPVETIDKKILNAINEAMDNTDELTGNVVSRTKKIIEGELRICRRCGISRDISEFKDPETASGWRLNCLKCRPKSRGRGIILNPSFNRRSNKEVIHIKKCPNCDKEFPLKEFETTNTASGKRRLCGSCQTESIRKQKVWKRGSRYRRRY